MEHLQWRIIPVLVLLASLAVYLYVKEPPEVPRDDCSLSPHWHYWIKSKRIVTPSGVISGAVEVKGKFIASIVTDNDWQGTSKGAQVIDYGEAVVMPGLVDV